MRSMMMMKKTIILCSALLISVIAGAQTQSQEVVLTLEKAIEIALDENPTIKIANLEIDRQDYVRKETKGNLLPKIGVTGSYTRAIVKSEMGGGISFDPDNSVAAVANLNLPLFAPSVYKTLKLNEQQMNAAVEAARASKITLVNEVKKSYYNILLAEKSLDVLRSSESTLGKTVSETKTKFDNGLASEYDMITANVQLSNLKPTIIQTENSIGVAKKMLKMYLSIPESINIAVTGSLNDMMDDTTAGSIPTSDVSSNSDLKSMEIQIGILEQQLKLQRTSRMPTLGAFANFQIAGRDPIDMSIMGGGGGSSSFMWTHPFSVGLQISIPIFDGFTKTNKEKQIKNNISQLKMQRDYLEEGVSVQLNNASNAVLTAAAMVNANSLTIEQANKGYDISQTRYNAGMGTMLELNNAELQLTQAKLNHTQAVYDYLSAQADYEKIVGKDK